MKKLLALALSVLSVGFVVSSAEAKAAGSPAATVTTNAGEPQINIRLGNNRRRNRRVVRRTRVSRDGRRIVTRTTRSNGRRTVTRTRTVRRPYRRY